MIYYDVIPKTLVGDLLVAANDKGLCAVVFDKESQADLIDALSKMFPKESIERRPAALKAYRREVEEYFVGKRTHFDQPIDWSVIEAPFQRKVLKTLSEIPFGRLISYGELATRSGSPGAARAVGSAMAANPLPLVVPCHRVVASAGGLGGYSGGLANKRRLLSHEGAVLGL